MKNGLLHRLLKIFFAGIFILGTIAIIYIGWKVQTGIQAANVDTSLNTLVCSNGKGYNLGRYGVGISSKADINFLVDLEFRYVCVHGFDISSKDKQTLIDDIFSNDRNYFSTMSNIPVVNGNNFGEWPIANPNNIYAVTNQKTDSQIEQDYKQVNKNLYTDVSYSLRNKSATPIKPDYTSTVETLLLFWFIFYILRRFIYFVIRNKKLNETQLKVRGYLHFRNPLIIPSLIIGACILVVAYLVVNSSNSTNVQETLAVNQKCHDLATKYVKDRENKFNTSPFGSGSDNTVPYLYSSTLTSYTYNQNLKTCLVDYSLGKSVNTDASPAPSPLPSIVEYTDYVDDVISGNNLAQINLDTDCDQNTNYCQNLVNFSLKEKSLGLSHLSVWDTLYLQTFDRLPFIRSWLGL